MSIAIVAGSELVLVGLYAVELTVEPKGVDYRARAVVRLHGDIVNIVERDYYYGSATMSELRADMLDLAGYAVDGDYRDALDS